MRLDLSILDNEYVAVGIALFVALYGISLSRIQLPGYVRNLFNNNIFRIVFLSLLLLHNFNKAPHVAVAVALIFVLTLNYLNRVEAQENFTYLTAVRSSFKARLHKLVCEEEQEEQPEMEEEEAVAGEMPQELEEELVSEELLPTQESLMGDMESVMEEEMA